MNENMKTRTDELLDPYRGKMFKGVWPTIPEMFLITLEQFPNHNCFSSYNPELEAYSYKEVHEMVMKIASTLIEAGVKKGDKVAINGKNSIQWGLAYLSVHFAGAVVVPFDNQLPIERVETLAEFADVVYLMADFDVVSKIDKDNTWFKSLKGLMLLKGKDGAYPSVMSAKPKAMQKRVEITEDDIAAILFTSGTTGNEKGAVLTHKNFVSDVYQAACFIPSIRVGKEVFYALLPLHHSYCCTAVFLESIMHGSNCLFGHGIIVSRMINDMKQGKVTIFMGIPLLYNKVLSGLMAKVKEKGAFTYGLIRTLMVINGFFKKSFGLNPFRGFFNKKLLSNLGMDHNRILICGAGPLAPSVFNQYQQLGLDFVQGYGLTETAPIVTLNPLEHFKVDSIGKPFDLIDCIIADPNEHGVGEIRVKGPNICLGYYKDEENTKALFDENGYLKTGDLGIMDSERYIVLKGRAKNIIVTDGGKNVYPEEIEDAFQLYSQVEQILIRGYQKDKNNPGEAIEAVIFPNVDYYKNKKSSSGEIKKDIENVVRMVNQTLLAYKKIDKITILDEAMEMTTTKKIKRAKVS